MLSENEKKRRKIKGAVQKILNTLVEGNEDETARELLDFKNTPHRVAAMLVDEMLAYPPVPSLKTFDIPHDQTSIIATGPLDFSSTCAHHMLPFWGKAWIAYLPHTKILGLSKPARVISAYSARFQIQERLTHQVLAHLVELLKPTCCLVVMRAYHGCMTCRGVCQGNAVTSTAGLFPPEGLPPETQEELYRAIDRCGT